MNRIQRCLAALARRARALPAFAVTVPAALFTFPPPEPPSAPATAQPVVIGGMPGWQITLIAAGAALAAAVLAVLLDRARAARRSVTARAA
jgi:hypothetical protein